MSFIRNSSFYIVVDGPTWQEAENNAINLGGNLLTINDSEENQFIIDSFNFNERLNPKIYYGGVNTWSSYVAWTGLYYDFDSSSWVNTSEENQTFFNWRDPSKVSYLPFTPDANNGRAVTTFYLSTNYSPNMNSF